MAKYQQYDKYKDSGVDVLGSIPTQWKISKLAYTFLKANAGEVIDKTYWGSGKEVLYTCNKTPLLSDYIGFPEEKRTTENDLLLTRNGTPYVHKPIEGSIYSNVVQRITLSAEFDRNYLTYCLGNSALSLKGYGVSIESFNFETWKSMQFATPSMKEQKQVVNFLDYETAQIDTLIEKQQTLIQLLKEKRQAVISHAVTKGLNPDAPMKDSGVEFLSEVPEHWKVAKLKFYTNQIVDGAHFTPTYTNEGVPFLRVTDIHNDSINMDAIKYIPRHEHEALIKRCNPQKGDLLLSKNGTIGIPKVIDWEWEFSIFVSLCLIKFKESLTSQYAEYFFKSHEIKEQISGLVKQSTVINLHLDKIQNFWFSIPPINEQYEIVAVLNKKIDMFDSLVGKAEQAIQLMQERRTALISAAVTGKIDVRGWVAPN